MSDTPTSAPAPTSAPDAAPSDTPQSEAVGEGQEQSSEQPAPPPKKKAPTFRTFKIGDEEVVLTDEDIQRDYQKWKGADQKFREAAQAKQSVDQFMRALAEDPESVLSDPRLPLDRQRLAEKWLLSQIEQELKGPPDPKEERLTAAERKLREYEEREAQERQAKEQQAYEAQKEARKSAIAATIYEAMQSTQLSADPESAAAVMREMAMYMRAAKEQGEEVTPQELVEHIHNTRFRQMFSLAHKFEGEELIEFLGDEIVNRLRKADLARLRAGRDQGQSYRTEAKSEPRRNNRPTRMDPLAAKEHARRTLLGK